MASPILASPASPAGRLLIPRVIHRVWLGDAPMPDEFRRFGETWAAQHPEWELKLWRDEDLPPLRNRALFDAATTLAAKADIVRYELLLAHGGLYVDTDFECLRPIEPLLADRTAVVASEDGELLSIGLMAAIPGHPLFEAIVEALPASVAAGGDRPPNEVTGPVFLTSVASDPALRGTFDVLGPELVYPYLWNEPYRRDEDFPGAYAVHHWAASWSDERPRVAPTAWRLVLATDWEDPATAMALLKPFSSLFGAGSPAELVFAVPHEPSAADLEHVQRLLAALQLDADACGEMAIMSFAEVLDSPFDHAVVPVGSQEHLLLEVGAAVTWLHETRRLHETYGRPAVADARGFLVGTGDHGALESRLRAFAPAVAAPAPPPPAAPAHRATYLGNDRLLVSTTWGGKLFMAASDLSLTPEVVHHGTYEEGFTRYVARTLRPGDVAFDVGANVGLFTLLMGTVVGPSGHVVAYEAAPANLALLRDTIAMNYQAGWVDVVPKAAAAAHGSLPFFLSTRFRGNGSLLAHDDAYRAAFAVDDEERADVPAEPLDVHLGRFPRISLVKIDVEGGEEQVLAGMSGLLASGTVDRVCFELLRDRMGDDYAALGERLRGLVAAGWRTAYVSDEGTVEPIGLDALLAHGNWPHALLERPGLPG